MNVLRVIQSRLFSLETFLLGPMCNEFLVCLYWINQNTLFISLILVDLTAQFNYILLSICITPPNYTDILLNCISLKPFDKCELNKFLYL